MNGGEFFGELIERVKQKAEKRKIYVWGAWKTGEEYIKLFQREGIQIIMAQLSRQKSKIFIMN